MIAEQQDQARIRPSVVAAFLAVVYVMGTAYFLLGRAGLQSLTVDWQDVRQALPLYALVCAAGAVSSFAVLRWKRWGVYGLALTWAANIVVNSFYPRPIGIGAIIFTLVLIALFVVDLRRVWPRLT